MNIFYSTYIAVVNRISIEASREVKLDSDHVQKKIEKNEIIIRNNNQWEYKLWIKRIKPSSGYLPVRFWIPIKLQN